MRLILINIPALRVVLVSQFGISKINLSTKRVNSIPYWVTSMQTIKKRDLCISRPKPDYQNIIIVLLSPELAFDSKFKIVNRTFHSFAVAER
jgi:hypothetical protein